VYIYGSYRKIKIGVSLFWTTLLAPVLSHIASQDALYLKTLVLLVARSCLFDRIVENKARLLHS